MKSNQKDKIRLFLITAGTLILLITAVLYGLVIFNKNEFFSGRIIPFLLPLAIVVFMAFFIVKRRQDIRSGLPFEDERSKRIMNKAAAMSFYASLYWLLGISFFEAHLARLIGTDQLAADQVVGGGIAGMAILFFTFWLYYDRKGDKTI
ncbi:MAG: hypothetical protein MUC28_02255 [Planctomycetes bacterium]|jgi:hypothetical protein|nr:hypothetical protein [Planctomycetota bacterium]